MEIVINLIDSTSYEKEYSFWRWFQRVSFHWKFRWTLCIQRQVGVRALLILYEDDALLMGNNVGMVMSIRLWLSNKFSIKDLGEVTYILGICFYRDRARRMIGSSQSQYIENMLNEFSMGNSKKDIVSFRDGIPLSKWDVFQSSIMY